MKPVAEAMIAAASGLGGIIKQKFNYIFSPGSGAHHGQEDRASGFCYLNDIVICILYLKKMGINKKPGF